MFRRKRQSLKNLLRKANVDIDLNSKFGQKVSELFAELGFKSDDSIVYIDTGIYDIASAPYSARFWEIQSGNYDNLATIFWNDLTPRELEVYYPNKGWSQIDYEKGNS